MRAIFQPTLLFVVAAVVATGSSFAAGPVQGIHLHNLSDFRGTIPYNHVRLHADRAADEVYVTDHNLIRVFNHRGMEIYRFEADPALGAVSDLAVDEGGDILVLSRLRSDPSDRNFEITRCDYRGNPKSRIEIVGLPPELSRIRPNTMRYRDGRIYLVSTTAMLAVVLDRGGAFQRSYDFMELLAVEEKDRGGTKIAGFALDEAGNMLLTVPVRFVALVVSPAGKVIGSLGRPGSGPGTFGIPAGIASDANGNYLVSEKLRSVVMVFDSKYQFLTEFGSYGKGAKNLVIPNQLAVGNAGRLYVTQLLDRGVSVFSLKSE